jgi:peptide/nickel transport system substrate-binding protein
MIANPQTKIYLTTMFDYVIGVNPEATELSQKTGLAKSWQSDKDRIWTLQIRDDVSFSNGDKLTSSDVKFSLERILSKDAKSPYAAYFQGIVQEVTAPSPTTVVVTLKSSDFTFPYFLSPLEGTEGMVVPQNYVKSVGAAGFATKPIGSGPYVLDKNVPGSELDFKWTGRPSPIWGIPRYGTIVFKLAAEESTREAMLRTHSADLIDIDIAKTDPAALKKDGFRIVEKPGQNVITIVLHSQGFDKSALVSDQRFREALALAINKAELNQAIYRGLGKLTGVGDAGSFGIGYKALAPYPYDPTKAKALLQDVGYRGQQVTVYSFDIAGVPGLTQVAQAVLGYWKNVGINAQLRAIDFSSFRPLWFAKKIPGQANPIGTSNQIFPMNAIYASHFSCAGSVTYSCDPAFEDLLSQAQKVAGDKAAYASWVPKLNQYIYDHYMAIPIVEVGSFFAGDGKKLPGSWRLGKGVYDMNTQALFAQ